MHPFDRLNAELNPLRQQLLDHPVYEQIRDLSAVRTFMEYHVYAVWDFMSLLKTLQQRLTCITVPWLPPANPFAARLVNEIVLAEETDLDREGRPASHFDLYLDSMREAGADPMAIEGLFASLSGGESIERALAASKAPEAARQFVRNTFAVIDSGDLPSIASSFTFGREDLLPGLFAKIIEQLHAQSPGALGSFVYYLDRHVALDGDQHGPMARKLMTQLCGDEPAAWDRATSAARLALQSRLNLWNAMHQAIA
jgi:hypothetical protein